MSLHGKLERWREAGLIDTETARRIAEHEESRKRPVALYAVAALGAGTVALGIISLVAANWDEIPPRVKLACDLLLGAGLATAIHVSLQRGWTLAVEALVTVFYGFTLASLALVGQVYQLGTPLWQALLVWTGSTLPLVLLAQSRYVAVLVVLGWITTHGYAFEALFDYLDDFARHGDKTPANVMLSLLFASPLAYAALGRQPWLVRERPQLADVLVRVGFLGLAFGGFATGFVWYESQQGTPELTWGLLVAAALSAAFLAALPRLFPGALAARRPLALALGVVLVTLALGTWLERSELAFVGALAQIAFLAALAWASLAARELRVFNVLTFAIGLRVLAVYFEVFHSLFNTGLGLVIGGLLTLLLAWLWRSKTRTLVARLSPPGAEDGGNRA